MHVPLPVLFCFRAVWAFVRARLSISHSLSLSLCLCVCVSVFVEQQRQMHKMADCTMKDMDRSKRTC